MFAPEEFAVASNGTSTRRKVRFALKIATGCVAAALVSSFAMLAYEVYQDGNHL